MRVKIIMGFIVILVSFFHVSAQKRTSPDSLLHSIRHMSLEELMKVKVVSATRYESDIKNIPQPVYVLTHQEIEQRGYGTLLDVLHAVSGVDIIHTNGLYPELVSLRGIPGPNNQFKIYVDGIPEHNLYENSVLGFALDYDLDNVDRIEILYGPSSTLYGTSAIGAIIQIFTREATDNAAPVSIQQEVQLFDGNFRNKGLKTSIQGGLVNKEKNMQVKFSGFFLRSDGLPMAERSYPVFAGASVGTFFSPKYSGSWKQPYRFNIMFKKGDISLKWHYWIYRQGEGTYTNGSWFLDHEVSDWIVNTPDGDLRLSLPRNQWSFKNSSLLLQLQRNMSSSLHYKSQIIYRNTAILPESFEAEVIPEELKSTLPEKSPIALENVYAAFSRRNSTSLINEHQFIYKKGDNFQAVSGLYYEWIDLPRDYETSVLSNHGRFSQWSREPRLRIENFAIYCQSELVVKKARFFIGVRGDHYFYKVKGADFSKKYQTAHPRIGFSYQISEHYFTKFNIGSAFRTPTAWELFSTTVARISNPNLKPEKSLSMDFTLGGHVSHMLFFEISAYYTRLSQLIQHFFPIDSTGLNQNRNAGWLDAQGIELKARWQMRNSLFVHMNVTVQHNQYHDIPASIRPLVYSWKGSQLPYYPTVKLNFNVLKLYKEDMSVNVAGHFIGVRPNIQINPVEKTNAYFQMDLVLRKYLKNRKYNVYAKIMNLFDVQAWDPGTRVPYGKRFPVLHPVPGRIIMAGVEFNSIY